MRSHVLLFQIGITRRAAREWKIDNVSIIVYMIQYGYLNRNIDIDEIVSLLTEWEVEDFVYAPSKFHVRKYFDLKSQIHDPDNPVNLWMNTTRL